MRKNKALGSENQALRVENQALNTQNLQLECALASLLDNTQGNKTTSNGPTMFGS